MSGGAGGSGLNNARNTPKDAQVMISLLREMGISDYEPRVLDHMLDFTYKYVTNVLEEARVYSTHSKKRNIDIDDVRLAIQLMSEKSFTNPPARDMLMEIARTKNAHSLPLIKSTTGARLPPDRYTLTSTNYRCKTKPKPPQQKILQTGGQQTLVSKPGAAVTLASKQGTPLVVAKPPGVSINVSAKPKPISLPISGMPPINIVSGEWKRKAEDEAPQ